MASDNSQRDQRDQTARKDQTNHINRGDRMARRNQIDQRDQRDQRDQTARRDQIDQTNHINRRDQTAQRNHINLKIQNPRDPRDPRDPKNRRNHIKTTLIGGVAAFFAVGCNKNPFPKTESPKTESPKRPLTNQKKYRWKMVTTWPKNFPGLGTGANKLARYIESLTHGQIAVKVYGASELVPALGVFDAVQRGGIQMGHGVSYYWQGKHPATSFFGAVPFGLNAHEMNAWLYYGGGLELWHKLYKPFGLMPFPAGNTGVQMGGWFNKKLTKISDFKGLKVRMPGLGGSVLSKLGSTVVTLSGGEIFQALKTKTIDGSEWVGPYNDLASGLHKAAKYYYTPGWHEPGTTVEALINKEAFLDLPETLQEAVKLACQAANQDMMSEFTIKNAQAFQEIQKNKDIKVLRFTNEILKEFKKTSELTTQKLGEHDEISKEIFESFKNFKTMCIPWDQVSENSFSLARNL